MTCFDWFLLLCVNMALVVPAIWWSFNGVEI